MKYWEDVAKPSFKEVKASCMAATLWLCSLGCCSSSFLYRLSCDDSFRMGFLGVDEMKEMKLKEAMGKTFQDIREACTDMLRVVWDSVPDVVSWSLFALFIVVPSIVTVLIVVIFFNSNFLASEWFPVILAVSQVFWGAYWISVKLYMLGLWS